MQEPILTLHAAHDYETQRAFLQAKHRGWPFALISLLVLGAALLALGIAINDLFLAILSGAFLVLIICSSTWSLIWKPNERKLFKYLQETPASETLEFFHDRIEYTGQSKTTPHMNATWQYDNFVSAWEFPSFFTLNSNSVITLFAKDAMNDHQQQVFRELMTEKYGKKFAQRKRVPNKV